jgi:hypothetical protein
MKYRVTRHWLIEANSIHDAVQKTRLWNHHEVNVFKLKRRNHVCKAKEKISERRLCEKRGSGE